MKHYNRIAALGFMLAALMSAQGTDTVLAAEALEGLALECLEESEQGSFTDASGVTYDWKACGDGTAEITGFSFAEAEPVIVIPESIDGYPITALTGSIRNAAICELVIPETITYLGDNVFTDNEIGVLRYYAADADNAQNFFAAPFAGSRVHELQIGAQVEAIRGYTFYNAKFCGNEAVLDVPEIEAYAFCGASFETLVLSGGTVAIGNRAFSEADIHFLSYHCPDARLQADSTAFGPFYLASIHGLEFSDDVRMIPDYLFSNADMKFSEFSFGQERIGDYAFYGAWDALGFVTGADMAAVTIGEGVVFLGKNAFGGCRMGELRYLANAACGAGSTGNGPFYLAEIGRLTIGKTVESIPAYLFANARFTEKQDLYLDVPVGDGAFYSGYETGTSFGELTIGENVELLGKNAFSGRSIENFVYLAEQAETACTQTGEAPFCSCRIGKFMIGEAVAFIDAAAFSGMHVSQEELVIPDSVRKIGSYVFYGTVRDTYEPFETLRVGSGLEELAGTAFAGLSFMDVYVEALGGAKEPDAGKEPDVDAGEELDIYPGDLPSAENLFIHRGSDFYPFFSTNAAHVTLYCDDYMVSSEGERCWDEESGRYVASRYETCSVCGYRNVFYVYEDGTKDKPEPEKKPDPEEKPEPEKPSGPEEKPAPEKEEDSGQNPEEKQEVNSEKKPDSGEEFEPEKKPDLEERPEPEKTEDSRQNPEIEKESDLEEKPALEKKSDPEDKPEPEKTRDPEEESELEKTPDPEEESEPEKTRDPEEESEPEKEPEPKENPETEEEPERKTDVEQNTGENPEAEKTPDPEEKPESEKRKAFERNPEAKDKELEKTEMPLKPARRPIEDTAPETDANMQDQSGQETADTDRDGSGAYEQKLYITIEAEQAGQQDKALWILLTAVFFLGFCFHSLCACDGKRDVVLILFPARECMQTANSVKNFDAFQTGEGGV